MDKDKIKQGAQLILEGLEVDLEDPNFKETPERISRLYLEMCSGLDKGNLSKQLESIFSKSFPTDYTGMVVSDNIRTYGLCPHHFAVVEFDVQIGIIYDKKCLGLSKVYRVVDLLSRRPVLQEQLTHDIVDIFKNNLKCKGIMCIVKGKHGCMRSRGVRQSDSVVTTSAVYGIFEKDIAAREEFLRLIRG